MESYSRTRMEDEQIELPPGFRFHPTDEELITHYLLQKVLNSSFAAIAIGVANLNMVEPWDLPRKAKMGEKEWYFFCLRDRKYPTGLRTNRATEAGYWKATGKDKEIYKGKALVGMKKTLVFYTGRAPKGEKTNWVMHEYRLEGKYSKCNLPKTSKNEWVISRVFKKTSGGKKPNHAGFVSLEELQAAFLPPLMDSSPCNTRETKATSAPTTSHMTNCLSSPIQLAIKDQKATSRQEDYGMVGSSLTTPCSIFSLPNPPFDLIVEDFQYNESIFTQDQSILSLWIEENSSNLTRSSKGELSQETGGFSVGDMKTDISSAISDYEMVQNPTGPIDLDSLWDY